MFVRVINTTKGVTLATRVKVADSLASRLKGLLGTERLSEGEGLWLTPCTSVHTFFMRYAIDVAFLDAQGKVLGKETLAPWRLSSWNPKAAGALELPVGTLDRITTHVGDLLTQQPI